MKIRSGDLLSYKPSKYDSSLNAFIPSEVIVSLVQDNGKIAVCTVKEGEVVQEGQVIAKGKELNSSVIHSPVPGIVVGTVSKSMPNGLRVPAVKIQMKGEFSLFGKPKKLIDWKSFPVTTLKRNIVDAGIVNTFDEPVSLGTQIYSLTKAEKNINVVLRMFDNDPSCTTDLFIAEQYTQQVLEGARILASAINSSAVIGFYPVKTDFMNKVDTDSSLYAFMPVDISVYPCGGKNQLVQLSESKNSSVPKVSAKDLFIDSSTALAVYEAVVLSQPVVDKIIQVSGQSLVGEGMIRARIGTSIRALAAEYGGFIKNPAKVIINGLLMGTNIVDLDTPITKYVKSINFMQKKELRNQTVTECLRCGSCRNVCPSSLVPDILYSYYKNQREEDKQYVATSEVCSGCGLCNSVCPARLPLCQTIKLLKGLKNET